MGFKDKVMNSLGFQDQAEDEYTQYEDEAQYEEEYYEEEEAPKQQTKRFGFASRTEEADTSDYPSYNSEGNMRIVLLQPTRFEEAQNIASYLLERKVVVFDLQECDVESAINIVNFVSGAIYALSGSIQKINDRGAIFVAVPPNVIMDNELHVGFGESDYGVNIADWVNRTHSKSEFQS